MSAETERPKRFDPLPADWTSAPSSAEEGVLALWKDEQTFERLQESRRGAQAFVFWEGPPTANGRPGIHHVLARSIKDSVCRFHAMLGERVERKAGWDTHGLPVELEVEKQLGISGKPQIEKLGVAEFNQKCRESVWKYREEWERLSARIGFWLDYEHPYVTYESEYVDSIWYLLARMHREKLVYRGKRVLPFCGRCGTGLSSHELGQPGVYRDVVDPSVFVRCVIGDDPNGERHSILVWTTTPWTLPSNVALAVHPDLDYVLVRVPLTTAKGEEPGSRGYEQLWIAENRVEAVFGKGLEIRKRLRGYELPNALASTGYRPLFDGPVVQIAPGAWKPDQLALQNRWVYPADYVTAIDGTGIVHQAPAYGADDWSTAQEFNLPVLQAVGPDGRFVQDVGPVSRGTFFKDADDALIDDLKARGLLYKRSRESHSYPHCWRCSTPLFYFASPAWYIRTTALKERMLVHNQGVRWVPDEIQKRFGEWLENNIDWNISRDRYWGTPLPFWVCENGHEVAVESAEELKRLCGALPDGFDHHKPSVDQAEFPCPQCKLPMRRTPAVLDCWFDSGAMPYAQYGWPHRPGSDAKLRDQFPATFICEGLDQTRGWFYTLHAIGAFVSSLGDLRLPDGPTYRTCLVNGLVLDKHGVKMSKRLGNVVDPWKVIGESGADAVRWYLVTSGSPWQPKKFDSEGLAEVRRRFFLLLANSYQFFREYARLDGFDPSSSAIPPVEERSEIDRWLVSRTQSLIAEVRGRLSDFDLGSAASALERFVVDDVSGWYIRRNRRRFWKGETGADKLAAFATLFDALRSASLCLAPFAPFLSELFWRRLEPGAGSVHAQLFPSARKDWIDGELEASMRVVQQVVAMGRALREKAGQRVRQPLRALHLRSSDAESLRLLATPFASSLVLDELNIKSWGSLAADDGQLVKLIAKPNFKVLGKKIGPRMKAVQSALAGLGSERVALLRAGQPIQLTVEGELLELTPEDVQIQVETQATFDVETDGRFVVWLDVELDEELVLEGLAREVVNRINGLRKDRGLAVEDRVGLELYTSDSKLRESLLRHRALIAQEVLAVECEVRSEPLSGPDLAELDLGARAVLSCALVRSR